MELKEYILNELDSNIHEDSSMLNEGLFDGIKNFLGIKTNDSPAETKNPGGWIKSLFGMFSGQDSKDSDDPVVQARKKAAEDKRKAIEDKRKEVALARKKALAAKIEANSAQELNKIKLDKKKKVDSFNSIKAQLDREKAFWDSNTEDISIEERMGMVSKAQELLDVMTKTGSPEELDDAEKMVRVMQKYSLKPDGQPWKDTKEFNQFLKDNPDAKKEIEKTYQENGNAFKVDENDVDGLSKVFEGIGSNVYKKKATAEEKQKFEQESVEFEANAKKVKEYLEAQKKYDTNKKEHDEKNQKADEEKKKIEGIKKELFGDGDNLDKDKLIDYISGIAEKVELPRDDDDHPDTDKYVDAIKSKLADSGIELPSTVVDKLTDGLKNNPDKSGFKDVLKNTVKEGDAANALDDSLKNMGESIKKKLNDREDTINRNLEDSDLNENPSDNDDFKEAREIIEKDPRFSSPEEIDKTLNEIKEVRKGIAHEEKRQAEELKLAQENQKDAKEALKSDKTAHDDPDLKKAIDDASAGISVGDSYDPSKNPPYGCCVLNDKGEREWKSKPEASASKEEKEEYVRARDYALASGVKQTEIADIDWEKTDEKDEDGKPKYKVTYKIDGEEISDTMSQKDLARLRASNQAAAQRESRIMDLKNTAVDALKNVKIPEDGKFTKDDIDKIKDPIAKQMLQDCCEEDKDGKFVPDEEKLGELRKKLKGTKGLADVKIVSDEDLFNNEDEANSEDEDYGEYSDDDKKDDDNDKIKEDPRKEYHKKKKKNGKGSTKNYYDKNGENGIPPEEYKRRVRVWKEREKNKETSESLTLQDYIKMIFG